MKAKVVSHLERKKPEKKSTLSVARVKREFSTSNLYNNSNNLNQSQMSQLTFKRKGTTLPVANFLHINGVNTLAHKRIYAGQPQKLIYPNWNKKGRKYLHYI